jgi:energy-coupling factor transport system permease protein
MAWWLWALGLAVAVSQTTNPVLLLLVLAVLWCVVANRRGDAPWSRAFRYYLVLAGVVVAIRVVFRSVFGGDISAGSLHVWFTLPHVPLPGWAAGVQVGGPVTVEGTVSALYGGLQLGVLLCCLGAANSLADPKRAVRALPAALYELGAAVVVAVTMAPQLVESLQRVRRARRLRSGPSTGTHALRTVAVPVLVDALDRSLRLAAAMDSRGYGRSAGASADARRTTAAVMVAGMVGLCLGAYGLVDTSSPGGLGVPALAIGAVLCLGGLVLGGRRVRATRYRPDPWEWPEWLVALCGAVPAAVLVAGLGGMAALHPSTDPVVWPSLPIVPALAVLVGALPAVVAPPPVRAALPPEAPSAAEPEGARRGPGSASHGRRRPPAEVTT